MAFSAEDIVPDSPTNNFCTLNPLDDDFDSSVKFTYQEGNLKTSYSFSNAAFQYVFGSLAIPSNSTKKYYWEWTYNDINNNAQHQVGICAIDSNQYTPSARTTGTVKEANVGTLRYHSTSQAPYLRYITSSSATSEGTQIGTMSTSATYNNLSVLSLMYDAGAGKLYGWLNGEELAGQSLSSNTSLWDTFNTSKTYMIMLFEGDGGTSTKNGWIYLNFGQDPTFGGTKTSGSADAPDANGIGSFYYQPPTGALALCTANLPDFTPTVIDDVPQDYFKAVIWGGNNTSQNITDVGFQPDLVWWKGRGPTQYYNNVTDSVRGVTKQIFTNASIAEETNSTRITGWLSNGFSVGNKNDINTSGQNYVAWCWKAGGAPSGGFTGTEAMVDGSQTTCSALATSAGASITPTAMSVNTDAGFSIVRYSGNSTGGASIPTGLSSDVDFFIYKAINDGTYAWNSWHRSLSDDYYIQLNTTTGENNDAFVWDKSGMSNNVIKHGTWVTGANVTGKDYIIYAWHSVEGYSKFGSYTGKSQSPFPFVYVGFRPALIIIKAIDDNGYNSYQGWSIFDTARNEHNPANTPLYANASYVEGVDGAGGGGVGGIDILSNGFRILDGSASYSGIDGIRHIYMAFAEHPFKFSNAR